MKLRELEIENFGLFTHYRIELPGDGLQVVFGPNEAGKSTLLQLIRELLFGFAPRNPFAFPDHAGEMAATARVELADGSRLRFRRRKGRRGVVVGQYEHDGRGVDEAELAQLLGGAGPELFANVFGFSLAELATAEESLKRANLSEALYGGALGGLANFRGVLDAIRREHEQLFTPSAVKRPINSLLTEIRQQTRDLNAAQLRPREFRALREEAETLDQRVAELRSERDELHRRQARQRRLAEALQLWQHRVPLLDELAALPAPNDFPADGARRYHQLKMQLDAIQRDLGDFETELREIQEQLDGLAPRDEVVACHAEIRGLEQQLDKIRGFRRDLVLRQHESQNIKDHVLARLRQIDPEWTLEQLHQFAASLELRSGIESLRDEREELDRRRADLLAVRPALETDIAVLQQRLAELDQQQISPALADLVDAAHTYSAQLDRIAQWQEQRHEVTARVEALRSRLSAPFGPLTAELEQLAVPLASTVEEYEQRWEVCDQDVRRADENRARTEETLARYCRQRDHLQQSQEVPDRAQLAASRARRDAGWNLIRDKYVDGQEVDPAQVDQWIGDPAQPLPVAYEQAVRDADQLADLRQRQAEVVAAQDQLAAQIEETKVELEQQEALLQAAVRTRDACVRQWHALWTPCGLTPDSPNAMREWLQLHSELVEAASNQRALTQRIEDAQRETGRFESELRRLLGDSGELPLARLAEARRRVQQARDAAAQRDSCRSDLATKQQQLVSLQNQLTALQGELDDWLARWRPLMRQFDLPESWNVQTAIQVLNGLSAARAEYEQAESLDRRIEDMQQGLDQFQRDTARLCEQLAPDLLDLPPEHAAEELSSVLQQARQDEKDLASLSRQRNRLKQRVATKQKQRQRVGDALDELLRQAGADTEAGLLEVARQAEKRQQLQQQADELTHQLQALRGRQDLESFERELQRNDPAALDSELHVLESQLRDIDSQFDQALGQQTLVKERLRQMDRADHVADLQIQLESNRARLRSAVDQWIPLALAETVMREAMDHFEREHQPALLEQVARLFAQLTGGRYCGVNRKLDEAGTLVLQHADGATLEPAQLSTGTREQLYLAIRLAYILRYCREAEPLPVVMDDVLVNFDDQRAAQTLAALADVAQHVQVLLLTCHQSMLDQAHSIVPDLQPVELSPR